MTVDKIEPKDPKLVEAEIAKAKAETVKALAEADKVMAEIEDNHLKTASEVAKNEAEAAEKFASIEIAKVMQAHAEAELVLSRNNADRERDKRRDELTADRYHHRYLFDTAVADGSVKKCISQLATWERSLAPDEKLTVELVINSPGGDVVEGFALIDYINGMHTRGHTVNTVAYGMAASMGGVLLEIGKKRSMGTNAVLLIHEAQFGAIGSYGEIEDRVKLVDIFHEKILALFADRSNVTRSFIKKNWSRRDWWCSAETALRHGFVDEVV